MVVEGLMQLRAHVRVSVHAMRRLVGEQVAGDSDHAEGFAQREDGSEGEVVHDVGQVAEQRVEVVVLGPGLDVEVAGHAVDEEEAGEEAAGLRGEQALVLLHVQMHSLVLLGQTLHMRVHPNLRGEELLEGGERSVGAVVGAQRLGALEEAHHGEGLHLVPHADVRVGHAVHAHDAHSLRTPALLALGQQLPDRRHALAPDAPGREEVDEGVGVRLQPEVEVVLVQGDGVHAVAVELGQIDVVDVVLDVRLLPVPPLVAAADAILVELPTVHILRNIVRTRS